MPPAKSNWTMPSRCVNGLSLCLRDLNSQFFNRSQSVLQSLHPLRNRTAQAFGD